MGSVKLILTLFRRMQMGKEKFKEQMGIAYHEAGHSVIGYIHNHTTNFIDINLNIEKKIYPNVDKNFGKDEEIIKEISESNTNALQQRQQSEIIEIAKKYCIGLLAGTFAEFWFLYKMHPASFEIINKNDKEKVRNCINLIYSIIGNDFNRNEFINGCLNKTRDLVCDEKIFNKIKQIADLLICSNNLRIDKQEIENILNNTTKWI